jgi:hypothetical protein
MVCAETDIPGGEKKKLKVTYTDPMRRWTPWRGRVYTLYWRCEDEAS